MLIASFALQAMEHDSGPVILSAAENEYDDIVVQLNGYINNRDNQAFQDLISPILEKLSCFQIDNLLHVAKKQTALLSMYGNSELSLAQWDIIGDMQKEINTHIQNALAEEETHPGASPVGYYNNTPPTNAYALAYIKQQEQLASDQGDKEKMELLMYQTLVYAENNGPSRVDTILRIIDVAKQYAQNKVAEYGDILHSDVKKDLFSYYVQLYITDAYSVVAEMATMLQNQYDTFAVSSFTAKHGTTEYARWLIEKK